MTEYIAVGNKMRTSALPRNLFSFSKFTKFLTTNPIFLASINLMISAGVTAILGFAFWVRIARVFNSDSVGLATSLLSVSLLISLLGLAGYDNVFVRYLPNTKDKNSYINTGLAIAGLATGAIAGFFCLILPIVSQKLAFIDSQPALALGFIVFTVFTCWNTLTNAALVAYGKSKYVLTINVFFGLIKLLLPFVITSGGPFVIFAFVGVAQIVNVVLSVLALMKYCNYRPALYINMTSLRETRTFSGSTYLANIFNLLPDTALPLIVVNALGASAAAYFYIAFSIANLLYTIAFSTTQVLLAEASRDSSHMWSHIRKGLGIVTALIIPATALLIIFCPFVLKFFGHGYSIGAVEILRILCAASLAVMLYSVLGALFKLKHKFSALLATTASNAVSILILSTVLVHTSGLIGIGMAWLIGSWISVIVGGAFAIRYNGIPSRYSRLFTRRSNPAELS